jgi:long-chain acyl-CoA synthetase
VYYHGARVGFYTGDPRQITADMLVLRPTLFPCVPRLLNRVHALVIRDVEKAGGVKRALFMKALKYKHAEIGTTSVRSV